MSTLQPSSHLAHALSHHQAGRLDAAEALYRATLQENPMLPDALHLLGLIRMERGSLIEAQALIERAIGLQDAVPGYHNSLGVVHRRQGSPDSAASAFARATTLDPALVPAWRNLARLWQDLDHSERAKDAWQQVLRLRPDDVPALMALGSAAYTDGHLGQAMQRFEAAGAVGSGADPWLRAALVAMEAGDDARALAALGRARDIHFSSPELRTATVDTKLQHDAEQLRWLASRDLLPDSAIDAAEQVDAFRETLFPDAHSTPVGRAIPEALQPGIEAWYNRPLYIDTCPALGAGALQSDIDAQAATERYQAIQPGITWLDGLLRPDALDALRHFCMASTIWTDFRYSGGYVGTALANGFANGLLLQIAAELRTALPVLFANHHIRQMWAYKYDSRMRGITPHADEAALNVNFWITPDSANLDPLGGGLVVYRKEAPMDWDFESFNRQPEKLQRWVKTTGAERIRIAHRQNRAVIFNSNLVHETDILHFRPGYENRRINITMLFGTRGG